MNPYISFLEEIRGKTIALVYIFEGELAAGFQHYWVWKSNIISGWLNAIQEIGCLPLILDVRTFIQKAASCDLPHIDFILNLNCGCTNLSTLSLVPSMSSFLGIPCIPCDAATIILSENKVISNLIARDAGVNVPQDLSIENPVGVFRPLNLGSSIGVVIGPPKESNNIGTYQEFIPGYDLTIPIMFNPEIRDLSILPPIIYIPKNMDPMWIYDEQEKIKDDGFATYPIHKVSADAEEKILEVANAFPIKTYGRIDARIESREPQLSLEIINKTLNLESLFFIEANSMPTIEREDSFEYSVNAVLKNKTHRLHNIAENYYSFIKQPSINGFLLANAIAAFIAKY